MQFAPMPLLPFGVSTGATPFALPSGTSPSFAPPPTAHSTATLLELLRGFHATAATAAPATLTVAPAAAAPTAAPASVGNKERSFKRRTHPTSLAAMVLSGALAPGADRVCCKGAEDVTAELTAAGTIRTADGTIFAAPTGFAISVLKSRDPNFKKGNGWCVEAAATDADTHMSMMSSDVHGWCFRDAAPARDSLSLSPLPARS